MTDRASRGFEPVAKRGQVRSNSGGTTGVARNQANGINLSTRREKWKKNSSSILTTRK